MIVSIGVLAALCVVAASDAGARPFRSALIIGVNDPFDASQPKLRYADDDAARFYEQLAPAIDRIELLSILDDESQRLYPEASARARIPDKAGLFDALERLSAAARAARGAGRRTELYFIYTGHGRVKGGEGEVKLAGGGSLTRTELSERVLTARAHDRIHLIIDACNAYHLVNARGEEGVRVTAAFDDAFERFVKDHSLERFPNVGVVLSTSGAGATHEWSRYQGGVFSHEVRSALAGAADADRNGRVDYGEVEAFLAAANSAIPELKGKPKVFVRAPAIDRATPLFDLDTNVPVIELPESLTGHFYLEDDRGVRYAELNKAEGYPVDLHLVPRARYALIGNDGRELAVFARPTGRVLVPLPLEPKEEGSRERGEADDLGAFDEPFGPRFVDGFRAHLELEARAGAVATPQATRVAVAPEVSERRQVKRLFGYAAAGIALTAAVGSIWQARESSVSYDRYREAFEARTRDDAGSDVRRERALAIGLAVGAGVSAAASLLLLLSGGGD